MKHEKEADKKGKIKAIVFDLGKVLVFYDHMIAAKKMSRIIKVPPKPIFKILSGNSNEFSKTSDTGAPSSEYWNLAAKELGVNEIPTKEFNEIWNTIFWLNKPLISLIKNLKKEHKIALLSNLGTEHKKYLLKKEE